MATSSGGCRQTLIAREVGDSAGVHPSRSARVSSSAHLDITARQLHMALLLLSLPLASAAHAFHRCRGWKEFGYARLSDHARERFDRSARWVRDLAALSGAMERLPGLASALTGADGGRSLGLVAAGHIGRVASPESLAVWRSMARTHSVRELKVWIRRAAAAGSHWPVGEEDRSIQDLPAEGDPQQRVCLFVPAAVREAFAETLDLYRAVEGYTASVGEFIDSLIAESSSGTLAGKVDLEDPHKVTRIVPTDERAVDGTVVTEGAWADTRAGKTIDAGIRQLPPTSRRRSATRAHLDLQAEEVSLRAHARRWLQEELGAELNEDDAAASGSVHAAGSPHSTGSPHPARPPTATGSTVAVIADARMRRLLSLHDEIDRQLAEVVTEMADTAAWRGLGYAGLDDYARRGLGWSRSTLYSLVQLVRRLRRLPVVQQAYQQGRIGRVAAQAIAHILAREAPAGTVPLRIPVTTQKAWVKRAAAATTKRLHDETRAVARLMVMGMGEREPLDDRAWHASLHRQAGTARRRVQTLSCMALTASGPLLPLRLKLAPETAAGLFRVLAVARRDANLIRTFSLRESIWNVGHGIEAAGTGTVKTFSDSQPAHEASPWVESAGRPGFQTISTDRDGVPAWVALLAILQEFIETWDVDVSGRRPSAQLIYNRDGWRCMAPGCTSRRNLEVHHVVYRSRGGHDQPENLICLCRFHHQMGEHGMLARVRGEGPLGLVWQLGREGRGGTYKNELRLRSHRDRSGASLSPRCDHPAVGHRERTAPPPRK
ncbi:MAG: HNH endonuclease [Acidobacteria bacterium]|nr:MAG: HNH endonuclease [Acidobacteriota bacterium]